MELGLAWTMGATGWITMYKNCIQEPNPRDIIQQNNCHMYHHHKDDLIIECQKYYLRGTPPLFLGQVGGWGMDTF